MQLVVSILGLFNKTKSLIVSLMIQVCSSLVLLTSKLLTSHVTSLDHALCGHLLQPLTSRKNDGCFVGYLWIYGFGMQFYDVDVSAMRDGTRLALQLPISMTATA